MVLSPLNLKPLPQHQRALRRAGIESGVLEVDYQPKPLFCAAHCQRYSFARLESGRARYGHLIDPVLAIRFQRHLLGADEQLIPFLVSHPRFDFGTSRWRHFHGPRIVPDSRPCLRRPSRARSSAPLPRSPNLSPLPRSLGRSTNSHPVYCELTLYLAVLHSQGISVRVFHHLNCGTYPDDEVFAEPERFHAGVAASLITRQPAAAS